MLFQDSSPSSVKVKSGSAVFVSNDLLDHHSVTESLGDTQVLCQCLNNYGTIFEEKLSYESSKYCKKLPTLPRLSK